LKYKSSDISVVIPAFNCEKHIITALDSVFNQSQKPGQVIVVNDGSTDNTEEVILTSRYADLIDYHRIKNSGPGAARNFGVMKSSGKWIAFLDSDDIWINSSKLEKQIELINRSINPVLVDGFSEINWGTKHVKREIIKNGKCSHEFHLQNAVNATSSVLALKSKIVECGGFNHDIRFGEDRLLWLALSYRGNVFTLRETVVKKVNSEGNLTSFHMKNFDQRLLFISEMMPLIQKNEPISKSYETKLLFENLRDFFRVSFKNNNIELFDKVFSEANKISKIRLFFSRYFILFIYRKITSSFFPFSVRKIK
jgi:glycosyltransferase involved in cell wall biosynthesis